MSVFSHPSYDGHEDVLFHHDEETGLKAIIAVHSTVMGPAVGGCRMWNYASDDDALYDVLRLSRGMSYKNAMADLGLGGGKSVIIGDSKTQKTPELMRAFGRAVNNLGGKYISAEDVGISVEDIAVAREVTPYVAGLNEGEAASGDPSPYTAHGVFVGIRATAKAALGTDDLKGIRVSIQGLGSVGRKLARELHEAGAELIVADINPAAVEEAVANYGARAVDVNSIAAEEADIFAPCALGAILNDDTIPHLKVKAVAGAANNQLKELRHGDMLMEAGILYAPDYVINAGGIINVNNEVKGIQMTEEAGLKNVERIYDVLLEIYAAAEAQGRQTAVISDKLAEEKIAKAKMAGAPV